MNPLLVGGIMDIGKSLIDRLFPDPEQRAKAEMELYQMQAAGQLKETEVRLSAIMEEARSADPWTSRARPTFMYVFYLVIVCLVMVAPIIGVFHPEQMKAFFSNVQYGFAAIPEEMWWTFTVGYLGYSGARTFEKTKQVTR